MKKSKLITPGQIINIVNSSLLAITSINTLIGLIRLNVIQYYVLAFIVNFFLALLGIGLIIISSLCLRFTRRKTYTAKGEIFCLITIFLEVIIIILEIINIILIMKMFYSVNPIIFVYIFVSVTTTIFMLIGFKESVVGSKEEIDSKLNPITNPNFIIKKQQQVIINNKVASANICFSEKMDKLEKMHNLYQKGILTKEEYEEKKKNILSQIK